jgi:hypothetical protein
MVELEACQGDKLWRGTATNQKALVPSSILMGRELVFSCEKDSRGTTQIVVARTDVACCISMC